MFVGNDQQCWKIPSLAEITKPLRELLNKEIDWQWNT